MVFPSDTYRRDRLSRQSPAAKPVTPELLSMIMTALIPLLAWLIALGCLIKKGFDSRSAFLAASTLWGICATLLTEVLGLCQWLNRPALALGWTILLVAVGCWYFQAGSLPAGQEAPRLARIDKVMLAVTLSILAITGVIALVSPPNNWDSLTYHMTRVMNWIQQGSVAHFPTNDLRQIELNPWAEFAIMQFQILSGGDHLANLIQWFSMAGCIVGVSLIAGLLAGSRRGEITSGLLAATVPMAILQATSTQNDLVVSFWLVCFVAFGIKSSREASFIWALLMSCCLALAILTKGTAYLYGFPFAFWFLAQDLRRSCRQAALKCLLLGSMVLAINFGHYQRNYQLFGNPLQSGSFSYTNTHLSPAVLLSNLSRNLALHLVTPSDAVNSLELRALKFLHRALGLAIDSPETTWMGTTPERLKFGFHEDHSGNMLHLFLLAAAGVGVACIRKFRHLRPYTAACCTGLLLFCLLLRWQPWASRLQLPCFMLLAPVGGYFISEHLKACQSRNLIVLLTFAALPYLLCNYSRPIISLPGCPASIFPLDRCRLAFENKPERRAAFSEVLRRIGNGHYKNVGLSAEGNSWEYPLWNLHLKNPLQGPHIEHIRVHNVSASIPGPTFQPDVVVVINDSGEVRIEDTAPAIF